MPDLPVRPWSGIEIEQKLTSIIPLLDDAVAEYRQIGEEAAVARHAHKLAEAKAMLQAKADKTLTSAELRKARVYEQVADLDLAADIAEARLAAQRQTIAVLMAEAEVLRSLNKSNRDMHDQPGWGRRGS